MKKTEELINEIKNTENVGSFIAENRNELLDMSLSAYLNEMLKKYGVKKSDLFRRAGQDGSTYGYELFRSDAKVPSRDILLSLCLAFPLEVEEVQKALRCAGLATLYPRNARDAYIIYAFEKKLTIEQLDELLGKHKYNGFL